MTRVLPIVEGHGELAAVPLLLRRLLDRQGRNDVVVDRAQRRGEWPIAKREFDRYYRAALNECQKIIWILDYDCNECVDFQVDAAWAISRARELDDRGTLAMCFVVMEFESLFLWEERPLRHVFPNMKRDARLPDDPEGVRDAKGCISAMLPTGYMYKPTTHQARLTAVVDLELLASRSRSFQRLESGLRSLLGGE
jgi:Domain of unknown function (DUF4276)